MKRRPLLAPLLLLLPEAARATVTLSESGKQFHSRPASFGFGLEYGLQYVAKLQVVDEDVHLCAGTREVTGEEELDGELTGDYAEAGMGVGSEKEVDGWGVGVPRLPSRILSSLPRPRIFNVITGEEEDGGGIILGEDFIGGGRRHKKRVEILDDSVESESGGRTNQTAGGKQGPEKEIEVKPSHGVPVAILAKRGQCTYETKARVASTLTSPHGTVRFVIVYDNLPGDGNHLITMMPKEEGGRGEGRGRGHDLWKEVGLVFVSYESGVDLREFVNTQSLHTLETGGPRILIDGSDHWVFPPMDESAAGLAFLLMLFGCVCSLSLFLNTTFYGGGRGSGDSVMDAHLFLLGPDGQPIARNGNGGQGSRRGGRGNGLRLLTLEEVETLPTREYCSPSEGERSDGDDPNSTLELRDKSEMPYMEFEEHPDVANDDEEGGRGTIDSSLHDGQDGTPPRGGGPCGGGGGGLCEHLLPPKKDDHFDHNSCSICLDEYQAGEQIRVLPCQHTFHSSCIFPWLTERSPTCPLCKAMFEAVQYEEEEEGEEAAAASNGVGEERPLAEDETGTELPPSEEEPPVHGRQRGRSGRGGRSRRNTAASDQSAAEASTSNDTEAAVAPEAPTLAAAPGRSSSGSRGGRWWGLFGAGNADGAPAAASGDNLEEPLLTAERGNDNMV